LSDWLCQDCKSVNPSGARNCYRCWTPRKFGEAPDPATLPPGMTVEQAHEERKRQLRPTVADARSSRRRSWVVVACITATVAFSALSLAFVGAKGGSLGVALSLLSGDPSVMGSLIAISLVGGLLALASMIAWFVWFDRVLANVPALTGTWPEVSRVMAVVWWLVPVVGQLKGTFVVGHVYGLMAVAGSPGLWLLGLWGVTWIGGTLAPGVAAFVVSWLPLPLEESVHLQDLISNLGQVSYIAAGFFAAALVLALEHAREVRTSSRADEAATELQMPLEDRLAGRAGDVTMPSPASGFPSSWHTGLEPARDAPEPWSSTTTPWPTASTYRAGGHGATSASAEAGGWPSPSAEAGGWPSPSAEAVGAGHPGAATWPATPRAETSPPAEPPGPPPESADDSRPRRRRDPADRGPVPFEPILLMGALVLAGVVAGITMAGMYDPLGTLGRVTAGGVPAGASPTLPTTSDQTPVASGIVPGSTAVAATAAPDASARPGTTAPATPAPTTRPSPTLVPADLVARRILRVVTPDDYRGLMDIDATYVDAAGDTTWTVRLGRVGEREYRLQTIERPGAGPEVLERAALVSSVWERDDKTDWVQRRKTDRDLATPPLFDLTDADQLTAAGQAEEDGATLYRFVWGAGDARLRQFLRDVGSVDGLRLRSGELQATADGVPVRLELAFEDDGRGDPTRSLRMTIRYSEVGSDIEVRSPRVGPPLVVRH